MRILIFLFVAAGFVAGWILIKEKREKMTSDSWASQMLEVVGEQAQVDLSGASGLNEANFFRILLFMHKLEGMGRDPGTVAYDAGMKISGNGGTSQLLRETLMENYSLAKRLKLFDDVQNLLKMEQGKPPLIQTVEWHHEEMTVGHLIAPDLAPEAANCAANLLLMPKVVHQAQDGRIPNSMVPRVRAMMRSGLIAKQSAEKIFASQGIKF